MVEPREHLENLSFLILSIYFFFWILFYSSDLALLGLESVLASRGSPSIVFYNSAAGPRSGRDFILSYYYEPYPTPRFGEDGRPVALSSSWSAGLVRGVFGVI